MPIHKMTLKNGVFYAKQVGYVDSVDAKMWANAFVNYAKSSDTPIMALIDMTEVDRLCPTMTKVFAKTVESINVIGIALVTSEVMASRNSRVITKLGAIKGVRVFGTYENAYAFTSNQSHPSFGMYTTYSTVNYSAAAGV